MADQRPITTVELSAQTFELIKVCAVVVTMLVVEWLKSSRRKAEFKAVVAESDAKVANIKLEATTDARSDPEIIGDYLRARGVGGRREPSAAPPKQ